ncbi:hypothetical protein VST7929_03033 [Vibrio stylophorae]|uniref:DUF2523 domain-containing protein n=1 Tax=Vibrio stylophorae TaxID=659351 RepID=A0ABM8ZXK8_9VIBR|nr:DUF2523 domain-containing protein [Vibrio stylophorae]CAH0535459.1 hypothetical protein VST7929_03033 [Vibrio stylophorae]
MPPLLVGFIGSLVGAGLIRSLVVHAAVSLGFTVALSVGMFAMTDKLVSYVQANMSGIPADVAAIAQMLGLDVVINIVISGIFWGAMIKGWINRKGAGKRYHPVWRKPGTGYMEA